MIATERLVLRPLNADDATMRYLEWFKGPASARITASSSMRELKDLREYISIRVGRDDVLFLGIFLRCTGDHIGNLKYEPIDLVTGRAVLGMFIGEEMARGRGFAVEAIHAANSWVKANIGVRQVVLGVETDNLPAVRAYEKVGFSRAPSPLIRPLPGTCSMVLDL